MKKSFLLSCLAVALLTVNQGYAQKCETGKDPFTGEPVQLFNYQNRSLYFENKSGNVKLEIEVTLGGEFNSTLAQGSEILLKLENDAVIKLNSNAESVPKAQVYGYSVITKYVLTFDMDKATLEKLAGNQIALIRFPNGKGGSEDREIKGRANAKYAKALQNGANCMLGRDVDSETQAKKKPNYNDEN